MSKRNEFQTGRTAVVVKGGWSTIDRTGTIVGVDGDVVTIQTANGGKIIRNYRDLEVQS